MKILVTGGRGFVARRLMDTSKQLGLECQATVRTADDSQNSIVMDINEQSDWRSTVEGVDCIIHCAARVHMMNDDSQDPLDAFRQVNTFGSLNLARQAADAGVKRFIYLSSIKVNGEQTILGSAFIPQIERIPTDPYALSKYDAEVGLREIAKQTGMEVVIIRPPLVYGPGVKANFASMMKWVSKGIPLPLGKIENSRSLVFVDNLVDFIIKCIDHPNAANQTFLISDDNDVSTTQLLRQLATALDVSSRLLPIPQSLLILAAKVLGKGEIGKRLCSSLQLDISKTKQLLNWKPPFSMSEGLKTTVAELKDK